MPKKKKNVTVTMKLNRDGTMTMRSTGGYDLRKLLQPQPAPEMLAHSVAKTSTGEPR